MELNRERFSGKFDKFESLSLLVTLCINTFDPVISAFVHRLVYQNLYCMLAFTLCVNFNRILFSTFLERSQMPGCIVDTFIK